MSHELKQVDVRLKLTDKESVFSREVIDTPEKAVSVLAPVLAELDREEVCVVNLDGKGRPINFSVVSIGKSLLIIIVRHTKKCPGLRLVSRKRAVMLVT